MDKTTGSAEPNFEVRLEVKGRYFSFERSIGRFRADPDRERKGWRVFGGDANPKGIFFVTGSDSQVASLFAGSPAGYTMRAEIHADGTLYWPGRSPTHARKALSELRARCLSSWSALVEVRLSNSKLADVSERAGKVLIPMATGRSVLATVPASLVLELDGRFWMNRKWAQDKSKVGHGFATVRLPEPAQSTLDGLQTNLERQLLELDEQVAKVRAAWVADAPARADRERLERERKVEECRVSLATVAAGEAAAAKAKERSDARLLTLPVHAAGVTVKGRDWRKSGGNMVATPWLVKNATVRVSGSRAYIFPGEGGTFWKPLATIEIMETGSEGEIESPRA